MVAGQTDTVPSSDDGGEEDREKPWTYQLECRVCVSKKVYRVNALRHSVAIEHAVVS